MDGNCENFYKDKVSILWIFLIIGLISLVVNSFGTGFHKIDAHLVNLNQLEKAIVHEKIRFDR